MCRRAAGRRRSRQKRKCCIVGGLQVAIDQQLVELAGLQRARAIFSGVKGFQKIYGLDAGYRPGDARLHDITTGHFQAAHGNNQRVGSGCLGGCDFAACAVEAVGDLNGFLAAVDAHQAVKAKLEKAAAGLL